MNSQTTIDITGFRSYLPSALRLRFDEQLSVRVITVSANDIRRIGDADDFLDSQENEMNASPTIKYGAQ